MKFAEIRGHQKVKELLQGALRRNRLPGALLFTGPDGVGKRALALAAARALLCDGGPPPEEQPQLMLGMEAPAAARPAGERPDDACGACPPCNRTAKGLHPDFFVLEPEGTSIKIERVRDMVREILARPFENRARAFVVNEAHLLTEQAQNALLKSLEEPPATSHVMLVTGAPQALLTTIRSRCQTLRVGGLPASVLEEMLRERQGLSADEARLRASLADGSLGAALAFEAGAYAALRDSLLALLETLPRLGAIAKLEQAESLADGDDVLQTLTALRSLLRDVAALRAGSDAAGVLNADVAPRLGALAASPLGVKAGELAEVVGETREALRVNANRLLSMDVLLDKLA